MRVPVERAQPGPARARRADAPAGGGRRAGIDLLHNLFTTAPALPGVPQVTTILDVIYKRFPEAHAGLLTYGMRVLVPLAARRSRRVLTLSEAAKDDIVRFLTSRRPRRRRPTSAPGFPMTDEPVSEDELRRRLGLGNAPIVLTVSAKRPAQEPRAAHSSVQSASHRAEPDARRAGLPDLPRAGARARADAWSRQRDPLHGLARRRPARRPLPRSFVLRLSLARRGLRPARSSTLSSEAHRPPARMLRPCPKSPATPSSTSTRLTSER